MQPDVLQKLEQRLGRVHARQRLGVEDDHEAHVFGSGLNFFHLENWYSVHSVIRNTLKLTGLYWRGLRNAQRINVRQVSITRQDLPPLFDGFTILHISDMHIDMNAASMQRLVELLPHINYDLCVLTGDYRGKTYAVDLSTRADRCRCAEQRSRAPTDTSLRYPSSRGPAQWLLRDRRIRLDLLAHQWRFTHRAATLLAEGVKADEEARDLATHSAPAISDSRHAKAEEIEKPSP